MSYVALAIAGSAVIGGLSSKSASKDVAEGNKKGMEQSLALTSQARQDVMKLFERSATNSGLGMKGALDYYKAASPKRYTPYLQGSQQAQAVIGQGAQQANNAILGLPVDMSFTQQPQIVPGTDHLNGAQIPVYEQGGLLGNAGAPQQAQTASTGSPSTKDILLGNNGLGGSTKKKLDSLSVGKKIVNKLF